MFDSFTLIAGPCALEDDEINLEIARALSTWSVLYRLPVIFKGSFDKANRTRLLSQRGPGLAQGLEALATVREETGLKVLTDIHEAAQAEVAAEVVDVMQIPAFLSRQTDLLIAAGRSGRAVNLKKGQWMCKEEIEGGVEKLRSSGATQIAITERGTFFGYNDLVVDMRNFREIPSSLSIPIFFDGTHSIQRPGANKGSTGGNPEYIPSLVRAAVAAGCSVIYLETHPNPNEAPSDGSTMIPLHKMEDILRSVVSIRDALYDSNNQEL